MVSRQVFTTGLLSGVLCSAIIGLTMPPRLWGSCLPRCTRYRHGGVCQSGRAREVAQFKFVATALAALGDIYYPRARRILTLLPK